MRTLLALIALSLASCANQGVNAYAYPNKIVLTQPMMDFVENHTELSFVFAHEVAHILRNQLYKRGSIKQEMAADAYAFAFLRVTGHDICLVAPFIARLRVKHPAAASLIYRHEQAKTQCKGALK